MDVAVNFRTTYYNDEGEEVTDFKLIAVDYLTSTFIFDILVCVPWQLFILPNDDIMKVVGILKVTRIPRLSSMINRLDMKDD